MCPVSAPTPSLNALLFPALALAPASALGPLMCPAPAPAGLQWCLRLLLLSSCPDHSKPHAWFSKCEATGITHGHTSFMLFSLRLSLCGRLHKQLRSVAKDCVSCSNTGPAGMHMNMCQSCNSAKRTRTALQGVVMQQPWHNPTTGPCTRRKLWCMRKEHCQVLLLLLVSAYCLQLHT